jgi:phosphatidate phosphatase APP1
MSKLKSIIALLGYKTDRRVDELRARLRSRLGYIYAPLLITPYRTYGTADEIFVAGRVLENKGSFEPEDDDTLWDNLEAMYRRFASREVPGVRIAAHYATATAQTTSDIEGYYQAKLRLPAAVTPPAGWIQVRMEAENAADYGQTVAPTHADVLIPPATAQYGVISDIDDTVVVTHAPHLLKMARMVFLNNARTRMPFPGVAAFYQALQRGASGQDQNPISFVSSSAWNIYDLLVDFMELNQIPAGPLLLTDYGANRSGFLFSGHRTHKMEQITRILTTYAHLPFILIGDSGQHDPEIYQQVVRAFPGRILVIYIRDVSQEKRDAEVRLIRDALQGDSVPMLLETDTVVAARHAAAEGYIQPEAKAEVHENVVEDEAAPNLVEAAVDATVEATVEAVTGTAANHEQK